MAKDNNIKYLWLLVLLIPVIAALLLMREEAFRYEHPVYLWGLMLLLPLILFFVLGQAWKAKKIKQFGNPNLIKQLMADASVGKQILKFILATLAFEFIVIGFANPQVGTKQEKVKRQGIDVIIALDVSNSMLSEDDTKISRLARSKNFISNFIEELSNDRLGMIVFAGRAYLQMPLTVDYSAARMYLKTINTNMMPTQGTNIAEAVDHARESFVQGEDKHKALIIISDGEDNEGGTDEAIAAAVKEGIKIYTIGVGSDKGSPIPMGTDFKRDEQNNVVLSKMNAEMLQEVAAKGNGKYYAMSSGKQEIESILKDLGGLGSKSLEDVVFTDYDDQFIWCLLTAALLLVLDWWLTEKKFTWRFNV
ncbi:MAG: VWA domain-containing protein [Chitinophagales bacterium]